MNSEIALAFGILVFIAVLIPCLFALSAKLGPQKENKMKNQPYESGIKSFIGSASSQFSVKYYVIAIVFVIFDIEVLFMYPWALNVRELGILGLVEMFIFMSILLLGLFYIYGKKALKWN